MMNKLKKHSNEIEHNEVTLYFKSKLNVNI